MSLEVVRQVKADLERALVDMTGPCGAFQITRRAAWRLRALGAGLLSKPGGNNCDGFSVDYIVFQEGGGVRGVDMLGDAGGDNVPQWNPDAELDPALAGRWRAPVYPGDLFPAEPDADDEIPSPPGQGDPPATPQSDLDARVTDLEDRLASLVGTVATVSSEMSQTHAAAAKAQASAEDAAGAADSAASAAQKCIKKPAYAVGSVFGYRITLPVKEG